MFGGTFFVYWRGYAVSFRAGVHRDAGMVPLSLQVTAKGENKTTQLAALRQVSSCFQHSHPRAKRKPDPRIKVLQPGSSPLGNARRKKRHKKSWKNNKKVLAGEIDL